VEVIVAADAESAVKTLRERSIALLVLDAAAPGLASTVLSSQTKEGEVSDRPPVVVLSDGGDTEQDRMPWSDLGKGRIVRKVESLHRLLDQSTLLLHRDARKLSDGHRAVLADLYQSNKTLAGKRVLIVDDDMRNIFALASVLEEYQMQIVSADNGPDAIELVQKEPKVDAILMDIMMPEMDGLDATRAIRALPTGKGVPIIAVTAKAMKGDRDRCLEAGAWDYLSKPVDRDQLLSTLRAWLYR
jgi:CheY-like chemotaxis protein